MSAEPLRIWRDGHHIADLTRVRGALRCRYTADALRRWPRNSPVISCSLPLSGSSQPAEPFFRGLLPEGRALAALAALADVRVSDTSGLLARFGRDIAGALIVSRGALSTRRYATAPYTDDELIDEVAGLDDRPLAVHDDSELSIAGLQNKLLLVQLRDGRWARPLHGQPSTHILKVDSASRPGIVNAEAQCLKLAHVLGLSDLKPELTRLGAQQCLIVERFDRHRLDDGEIGRVHQEDLCQATGSLAKYESRRRGGPGLRDAAAILDRYAPDPEVQLHRLLAAATFTLAIGNADAHGKNLAFVHDDAATVTLAPLYDTVPTVMWPSLRTEAAMSLNGRFSLLHTDRFDLIDEAVGWPVGKVTAARVVGDTLERLAAAIPIVLSADTPLRRTLTRRVDHLLTGAVAGPPASPVDERPPGSTRG